MANSEQVVVGVDPAEGPDWDAYHRDNPAGTVSFYAYCGVQDSESRLRYALERSKGWLAGDADEILAYGQLCEHHAQVVGVLDRLMEKRYSPTGGQRHRRCSDAQT